MWYLRVDDRLIDAISEKPARWKPELLLQVIQTVGLVAAGLWAYFQYLTFQKQSNELALDAARLNEQQARLTLKKTELEVKEGQVEVDKLTQTPLVATGKLVSNEVVGSHGSYIVTFEYSWTNNARKRIVVSPVMTEAFFARSEDLPRGGALVVNDVGTSGPLAWRLLSRRGYAIASEWKPGLNVVNGSDVAPAERGDGGTGELNSGETMDGIVTLLVHGRATDFVGFRIRYAVGDGKQQVDRRRMRAFSTLGDAGDKK